MRTRPSSGPSGVVGLLDHEPQIRPGAQKNEPHRGKRGGMAHFHDRNAAAGHTGEVTAVGVSIISLSRKATVWSRDFRGAPSNPDNRAVRCHFCCLLACWPCSKRILAKHTGIDRDRNQASPPGGE